MMEIEEDFECSICMLLLIKPITLPCDHSICMSCFEKLNNKLCPFCKRDFSIWLNDRLSINSAYVKLFNESKYNCLIDQDKWELVQDIFPEKVRKIINHEDAYSDDNSIIIERVITDEGLLRKEYEEDMKKLEEELKERRRREELESANLLEAYKQEDELAWKIKNINKCPPQDNIFPLAQNSNKNFLQKSDSIKNQTRLESSMELSHSTNLNGIIDYHEREIQKLDILRQDLHKYSQKKSSILLKMTYESDQSQILENIHLKKIKNSPPKITDNLKPTTEQCQTSTWVNSIVKYESLSTSKNPFMRQPLMSSSSPVINKNLCSLNNSISQSSMNYFNSVFANSNYIFKESKLNELNHNNHKTALIVFDNQSDNSIVERVYSLRNRTTKRSKASEDKKINDHNKLSNKFLESVQVEKINIPAKPIKHNIKSKIQSVSEAVFEPDVIKKITKRVKSNNDINDVIYSDVPKDIKYRRKKLNIIADKSGVIIPDNNGIKNGFAGEFNSASNAFYENNGKVIENISNKEDKNVEKNTRKRIRSKRKASVE